MPVARGTFVLVLDLDNVVRRLRKADITYLKFRYTFKKMLLAGVVVLTLLILQSVYTITMALPMSYDDECEDTKKVKKIIPFPVYYPAFYYPVFYYPTVVLPSVFLVG